MSAAPSGRSPAASRAASACPAIAALLLCVAAAGTVAYTLATVYRLHVPLPYWDEWYTVDHYRRFAGGNYRIGDLAAQHNEHRLLFPRLFFFADELLVGLSGSLNATVTILLQAVNAALLIGWRVRVVVRPAPRAILAGFVLLMLFTLRQQENFTNGFQLQFIGVFTAAALAGSAYATALDRLRDGTRGAWLFFALAAVGCFVATYTMANGVLAAGVLAAAAVLRRAPWPVPAATAAAAAVLGALFFHGYVPGGSSLPLSHALAHPQPYLAYLTAYLGNIAGQDLRVDQSLGTLGLASAAGAAWRIWRGTARDGASLKLLVLAGFVLASAAATTYGRIALGAEQALDSRYATPSAIFWCAMVLFWFPVAAASLRRRILLAALGAVMAVLSAAALSAEATAWPDLAARSAALRRVSDSLLAGVFDETAAGSYEITETSAIADLVPFLRLHRLSVFADPAYAMLGRPIGPASPPGSCDGTVAATADPALGPEGVRLSGRAVDETLHRAPRRILFADATGVVVGFGSASLPGEPSRLWSGYARGAEGEVLRAYARLGDGSPCAIGAATVGPAPAP